MIRADLPGRTFSRLARQEGRPSMKSSTLVNLGVVVALCALAAVTAAQAPPRKLPATPPPAHAKDPRLAELDAQIAAARADRKKDVDPLEAQLKALKERYDAQIDSLVAQRKAIVEEGESPELRELDRQETSELAALADREKSEVAQVHQRYDTERKQLKEKYAAQRKGLQHG
jgi:hypothetical protein